MMKCYNMSNYKVASLTTTKALPVAGRPEDCPYWAARHRLQSLPMGQVGSIGSLLPRGPLLLGRGGSPDCRSCQCADNFYICQGLSGDVQEG